MLLGLLFLFVPRTVSVGSTSGEEQRHLVNVAEAKNEPKEEPVKVFRISREDDKKVIEYIIRVFGTESETATRVFRCESNLRTAVISRTSDVGVAQINLAAHWEKIPGETREEKILWLQDYKNNIDFAYELYKRSGWKPW